MLQAIPQLLTGLLSLGMKFIPDADKKNEFAFKTLEMGHQLALKMLETKTYPWVDALVKLAYASETIVKGLIRPVGSFLMFGFAVYCEIHNITLSDQIQFILYGAPVGWGLSRHQEKKEAAKKAEKEKEKAKDDPLWFMNQ